MEIDSINIRWGKFVINELFVVKIGKSIDGNKVNKNGGEVAYITRKESANGLDGFIDFDNAYLNNEGPVITIGNETAEPFVQNYPFFTGTKVNILISKHNVSKEVLLFISQCLKLHKSKYSYSYTINSTRLKRQIIQLPINSKNEPDYSFMEEYIRNKENEKILKVRNYVVQKIEQVKDFKEVETLNKKEWGEFFIEDVFNIKAGKRLTKADMHSGETPFIGASDSNNGITNFVSNNNSSLDSNILGVNYNGSVVENFYHPYKAIFSDDVKRLSLKEVEGNEFLYLFIKTSILNQKSKFQYAYKFNETRMLRQKLLFPINKKGHIDYDYMENYIKKIEYEKLTNYIKLKTAKKK
ncbi:restriction endonuclease subunit S [Flavobacterium sp. MMLR14_040]|uniref:restriction endonuclease subunit S n=1 Tax=Flavobacterium sp. MMLR14_040 TaxID=3093843 RepID=UPI0029901E5C|nr:restriction endonuclease subunit S [Flavobacterium sp. MMLR14_040]MDW8848870.1 restriction endonuclease subunit S [Flavobacterium sp. MMLR14_040]